MHVFSFLTVLAESKSFKRSACCYPSPTFALCTEICQLFEANICVDDFIILNFDTKRTGEQLFRDSIVNKAHDVTSDYHKTRSTYDMEVEIILKN